jgi:hypothetical protein
LQFDPRFLTGMSGADDRAAHMVAGDENDHFTEATFSFSARVQPPLRKDVPAGYS